LALSDVFLLVFLSSIILEHFKNHHSLKSWSSIFHFLCLCWLFVEGLFWIFTIFEQDSAYGNLFYMNVLYWVPCPFQYGALLLLPLFFSQVLYPREWHHCSAYILPVYTVFISCLTAYVLIWALYSIFSSSLANCSDNKNDDNACADQLQTSSNIFRTFTAICYLTLAILQAMYSIKLHELDKQQYLRFLITSAEIISVTNIVLFVSFLSKGVYQLIALTNLFILPDIPLTGYELYY